MAEELSGPAIDLIPCYFFCFDNTGVILSVNERLCKDLGHSCADDLLNKKLDTMLTVGSRIFFQTHFYPLIKLHGKANEIYLTFKTREGAEVPVLLNVEMSGEGDTFVINCGGMKITNRNRFEKELLEAKKIAEQALAENQQLQQLKRQMEDQQVMLEKRLQELSLKNNEHRQLTVVLSHDLQEPLRKISLFANRMYEQLPNDADTLTRMGVEKINIAAARMRSLVLSMQKFLSLKNQQAVIREVDLGDALSSAMRQLGHDEHSFQVVSGKLEVAYADQSLIVEVFREFISNSVKFRDPEKELLTIRLHTDRVTQNIFKELENSYRYEEFLRIQYSDNGIGFENIYADQIFDLFRKFHIDQPGIGLGLAYCRKIIELQGGMISARSEKGKGTVMTILLPAYMR